MGTSTKIAWSRSTFSPWIGCTEVSPGCDACYAREEDSRYKWGGKNQTHWGAGVPRHRTAASTWEAPLRWNKLAALEREMGVCAVQGARVGSRSFGSPKTWTMPGFWPVFPSLCDPFDNEVPEEWRSDLWELIYATPYLTWLLLTKRIGNSLRMLPDYGNSPKNVWIGASIVNQEEADRDIPKLLAVRAAKRFVSYEPALELVDWWQIPVPGTHGDMCDLSQIDQIIVGGESNQGAHKARPFDLEWARSTIRQCRDAGVACFVKQLGSRPQSKNQEEARDYGMMMRDRAGANPAEWPADLRIQEWPK